MVRFLFCVPVLVWANRAMQQQTSDDSILLQIHHRMKTIHDFTAAGAAPGGSKQRSDKAGAADKGYKPGAADKGYVSKQGPKDLSMDTHGAADEDYLSKRREKDWAEFAARTQVYLRSLSKLAHISPYATYLFAETADTVTATPNECPTGRFENDPNPNCQWSLEPSVHDSYWYIRNEGTQKIACIEWEGNPDGPEELELALVPDPGVEAGVEVGVSCQWIFEPIRSRPNNFWIKSGRQLPRVHDSPEEGTDDVYLTTTFDDVSWGISLSVSWQDDEERVGPWMIERADQRAGVHQTLGGWRLLMSSTHGEVEYAIQEGITAENGTPIMEHDLHSLSSSIQMNVSHSLSFGGEALGAGYEMRTASPMNEEHSLGVALGISESLSQPMQTSKTVKCAAPSADASKVWAYQWVIHVGSNLVRTSHTRCHYTDGAEHPPQCPVTACGQNNEWCAEAKCESWRLQGIEVLSVVDRFHERFSFNSAAAEKILGRSLRSEDKLEMRLDRTGWTDTVIFIKDSSTGDFYGQWEALYVPEADGRPSPPVVVGDGWWNKDGILGGIWKVGDRLLFVDIHAP